MYLQPQGLYKHEMCKMRFDFGADVESIRGYNKSKHPKRQQDLDSALPHLLYT